MPASGELIRMMNYVDDILTTLRRITSSSSTPLLTDEERKRLADYMRQAGNKYQDAIHRVEQNK
jgi:hypothetical protein